MVNTISNEATIEILHEYSEKYSHIFPEAVVKWKQLALEDFEAPIEVRVSGDNLVDLKQTAEKVEQILKANSGFTWVRNDWGEMRQGISVQLDQNKASQLGYAKTLVAASLMTSLDGLPVTTIWEDDYPVSVVLLNPEDQRDNIDDLGNHYVSSPLTMESLPLRSIASLQPEWTEGSIARRNGVRTITVKADIQGDLIPSNVLKTVRPFSGIWGRS